MKYALIGCGRISAKHIEAAKSNNLRIVAVCDILPKKTAEAEEKFCLSGVKKYTDYKEMVLKEKPQLVAVATESGFHAEIALFCIKNGCNVIIEKPISLSIADADKIILEAKKNNVKVCACHQNRFNKSVEYIKKALDDGRFGRLFHGTASILWNRNKEYYSQASWRGTWEYDGGALMNQCIHNIDLLRWLMGEDIDEVVSYTDRLNHPYLETEDLGLALIKFKNGAYGVIEGTTNAFGKTLEGALSIYGEKGVVRAGGKSANKIDICQFADGIDDENFVKENYCDAAPNVYGFGHTLLYKDMVEAINTDREPYVTAEDGKKAVELVLAIYKSAKEHKPVKLPLENASTLDFAGRFKNE